RRWVWSIGAILREAYVRSYAKLKRLQALFPNFYLPLTVFVCVSKVLIFDSRFCGLPAVAGVHSRLTSFRGIAHPISRRPTILHRIPPDLQKSPSSSQGNKRRLLCLFGFNQRIVPADHSRCRISQRNILDGFIGNHLRRRLRWLDKRQAQ